jgi:ubiquitin-conjugating enzyme E2 S
MLSSPRLTLSTHARAAGTPYEGGEFEMRLVFGNDFPQQPPKGFFVTRIFHPNVSLAGEICVNTLKRDWQPDLGVKHILMAIRCLLIVPNPESALNEEAGKLLLECYDDYASRARMMTDIHARKKCASDSDDTSDAKKPTPGPSSTSCAAAAASSAAAADKAKADKKRALKRL